MSRVVKHEVDALEQRHVAYAVRVGERWFYSFGARGRVQTAWCIAGAKLYQLHELERARTRIERAVIRSSESKRVPPPIVEAVRVGTSDAFKRPSEASKAVVAAGLGALLGTVIGTVARNATPVPNANAAWDVPYMPGRFGLIGDGTACRHAVIDAFRDARDAYVEWCHDCGAMRRGKDAAWQVPNRVPGPLAAGPGVSGSTRGASGATEVGSVAASQPRVASTRQPPARCEACGIFGGHEAGCPLRAL